MQPFKLVIQEPCTENWNNMSPQEKGRFCSVCEKTVVDFTQKTPEEIKLFIDNSSGKVCGRVSTQVLHQTIAPQAAGISFKGKKKWWAWLSVLAVLGIARKVQPIEANSNTHKQNADTKKRLVNYSQVVLRGMVRDSSNREGLDGVTIKIYSGTTLIAQTHSFINGAYELALPAKSISQHKITFEFTAAGYENAVVKDIPVHKAEVWFDANLKQEVLHELIQLQLTSITMGGIGYEIHEYQQDLPKENIIQDNWHTVGKLAYTEFVIPDILPVYPEQEEKTMDESVEPKTEFNLKAYPNPTANFITVEIQNASQVSLQIFDLGGKLVNSFTTVETKNTISLVDFPNGTYVVRAIDDATNKVVTTKIIKVNQ